MKRIVALLLVASWVCADVPCPRFRRGDVNNDTNVNIADLQYLTAYFSGGSAPTVLDSADTNDDGYLNVADVANLAGHLQGSPSTLPAPFSSAGFDPTVDGIKTTCDTPGWEEDWHGTGKGIDYSTVAGYDPWPSVYSQRTTQSITARFNSLYTGCDEEADRHLGTMFRVWMSFDDDTDFLGNLTYDLMHSLDELTADKFEIKVKYTTDIISLAKDPCDCWTMCVDNHICVEEQLSGDYVALVFKPEDGDGPTRLLKFNEGQVVVGEGAAFDPTCIYDHCYYVKDYDENQEPDCDCNGIDSAPFGQVSLPLAQGSCPGPSADALNAYTHSEGCMASALESHLDGCNDVITLDAEAIATALSGTTEHYYLDAVEFGGLQAMVFYHVQAGVYTDLAEEEELQVTFNMYHNDVGYPNLKVETSVPPQ